MKVTLQNLNKQFPGRQNKKEIVTAISDFSYDVPDGQLVSLLGPSGCGKSTLLYLICGLETPTSGKIFFGDDDVTHLPPENRGIGLVFQNYALYPHLTTKQNIMFPLQNLKGKDKLSKEEIDKRVNEVAKLVQIEELLNRKPNEMSGGQQQRVAIARALVKKPKILLLDEPLSNLDARLRLQTREEIRRIQKETGVTTIFVTHDQDEAMSISDCIVVMKKGVLQQVGKPQEVYDNPVNLFVAKFLGTPQINVFEGQIKDGYLMIGEDKICPSTLPNSNVYVGIRPEGFIYSEDGPFHCKLERIEVRGRDVSILAKRDCLSNDGEQIMRIIIDSEIKIDETKEDISFAIKPSKLFVFSKEDEKVLKLN